MINHLQVFRRCASAAAFPINVLRGVDHICILQSTVVSVKSSLESWGQIAGLGLIDLTVKRCFFVFFVEGWNPPGVMRPISDIKVRATAIYFLMELTESSALPFVQTIKKVHFKSAGRNMVSWGLKY